MSALLSSPKVTVHIADGFEFLTKSKDFYDVIITDCSDPIGPAKPLFQKPYFQLLHDALAPGGHISIHGDSIWLHLELIQNLLNTTREIFPVSEYAQTAVPTYPSGQIGLIICAKAPGRDMKTQLREVSDTKYYNKAMHASAFHLPEFGAAFLEQGKDIRPKIGRELLELQQSKPVKKILLLGTGFVARPCAEYVVRDPSNRLTIGK